MPFEAPLLCAVGCELALSFATTAGLYASFPEPSMAGPLAASLDGFVVNVDPRRVEVIEVAPTQNNCTLV